MNSTLHNLQGNNLLPRDGELYYLVRFITPAQADDLYTSLLDKIDWHEEQISMFGKSVTVPRLVSWYGDTGARYQYSGVMHEPAPWITPLLDLKVKIEQACGHRFNSVLANYYRDGSDSMGWHADKEKELGTNPYIASFSLGEPRIFKLSHNKTRQVISLALGHGSLLLMGGSIQHHWRHCVPKSAKLQQGRINLTFRRIFTQSEPA